MAKLTDPGTELSDLIGWMRGIPTDNEATISVIAKGLEVSETSHVLIEALGGVSARLNDMQGVAEYLRRANYIHQIHVDDIRDKALTVAQAFHPVGLANPWSNTRKFITSDAATTFMWIGPHLQALRPLYRLDDEERAKAIGDIDATLAELESLSSFSFDREVLRSGLSRARAMLEMFVFFGHEQTSNQLLSVSTQFSVAIAASRRPGAHNDISKLEGAKKRIVAILAVMGAFSAPDAAGTAAAHYIALAQGSDPYEFKIEREEKEEPQAGLPTPPTLRLPRTT